MMRIAVSTRTLATMHPTRAAMLTAGIHLCERLLQEPYAEPVKIQTPGDVATLLYDHYQGAEQERFTVMLLNTKNHVLAIVDVYQGSVNTISLRIGELFKEAIRQTATAMIVAHNHPSGDPTPSPEDIAVTRSVRDAGRLMDIEILDHIVIGRDRHVSMKERRLAGWE